VPPGGLHTENWPDDKQTNRFGLRFGWMAVFWRGKGLAARKFAEAKNHSHWTLAYPRFGKESMAPTDKLVLLEVIFSNL